MNSMKRLFAALLVGSAGFGLFVACGGDEGDCTFDADCAEGQACEAQVCVDTCESDADCAMGEICDVGVNTEQKVCQLDDVNNNNGTTNNSTTNNGSTNNSVDPTFYYVTQILSVTSGADACDISDPGPDIFGVELQDETGSTLGWGSVVWQELQDDGNDFPLTAHLDGSAPALDGDLCVDFSEDTVVALGCEANNYIAVEFLDGDGIPIPLDATASQQITVHEYGGQCGTGTVVDEYDVNICTDTMAAKAGNVSSCNINIIGGGAGATTGDVAGF